MTQYRAAEKRLLNMMSGGAMLAIAASAMGQTVVPASLALQEGDALLGATINTLGEPFTNTQGQVGFTCSTTNGDRAIYLYSPATNTGSAIFDDIANPSLSGAEATIGISDAGGFAYSPSLSGSDALWTQLGLLHVDGQPAPQAPSQFVSFSSRPRMVSNGAVAWVGGRANTLGGATVNRIFYLNRSPSSAENSVALLIGGQTVQGSVITATGIGFGYDIADNASQYINSVTFSGSSATDAGLIKNGSNIVMREGSPTGSGANWQTFGPVGINNQGDYLVCGDTDAATTIDGFVSINGQILIREGEPISGATMSSTFNAASISNQGRVAFITTLGGVESLVAGFAANLSAATATKLLAVGDSIDWTGDETADATVTNFLASNTVAPGLDLSDDGNVFVRVDMTLAAGGAAIQAIIGLRMPSACDSIDFNGDGLFPDDADLIDFLSVLAGGPCSTGTCNDIDFNNDGLFPDDSDLITFLTVLAGGQC